VSMIFLSPGYHGTIFLSYGYHGMIFLSHGYHGMIFLSYDYQGAIKLSYVSTFFLLKNLTCLNFFCALRAMLII
jgi:hypothetical protein